jgi:leader peptidase (prepilin peptidase)/N-methyltransferase
VNAAVGAVAAGALGAVLGSFLNVVASRLPKNESLLPPWPSPGAWLRKRQILAREPLVVASTAVLLAAVVVAKGADEDALLGLALVLLLVPVTVIDIDHRIIPNTLMLIGAVVALALVLLTRSDRIDEHLIACAGAGGFLLVAALLSPAGMGMGDVKLAGVMGLFLGRAVIPAMFVALLLGSLFSLTVFARKGRAGRGTTLPFGPYLAAGALVGLFAGEELLDWYDDSTS